MGTSLAEALNGVELEIGRTYRCRVKEFWVELRVLGPVAEFIPAPIVESDIRLDAWTELPEPSGGVAVRTQWGTPDLPDVPDFPSDGSEP
jgi:hypothetical protein